MVPRRVEGESSESVRVSDEDRDAQAGRLRGDSPVASLACGDLADDAEQLAVPSLSSRKCQSRSVIFTRERSET